VGEVFADSLAVPGEAGGELDDGLPDAGADTGSLPSPPTDTATANAAGPSDLSGGADGTGTTGTVPGSGSTGGASFGSGSSGSASGTSSSAALGSSGAPASSPSTRVAAPAAARRVMAHEKPTKLLLLYLLWQSLVIGTVASLYLWRKAAV